MDRRLMTKQDMESTRPAFVHWYVGEDIKEGEFSATVEKDGMD